MTEPLPPGQTIARQLFARIVTDSQDRIDRIQAVVMVAEMLHRSPLDIGFDIGISQVFDWHPRWPIR
jgi:hypothetical protein